ncbi:staygreen family protein [Halalkalibacter nanhaiisediminis]
MRYGDRFLFNTFPHLDQAPIIIHFMSASPVCKTGELGDLSKD